MAYTLDDHEHFRLMAVLTDYQTLAADSEPYGDLGDFANNLFSKLAAAVTDRAMRDLQRAVKEVEQRMTVEQAERRLAVEEANRRYFAGEISFAQAMYESR